MEKGSADTEVSEVSNTDEVDAGSSSGGSHSNLG
jgi:hypothetical protein